MKKKVDDDLRARLAVFFKEYGRRAQRGAEPNDRGYDRKLEKLVKRLSPEELSQLLNEDDSEMKRK